MEIVLKELTFNNMFSYGMDNTVIFNKNKITQLTAPNGYGKSTIALILQELLFGKNIKGIKKGDILNRYSTQKSWDAALLFTVDEVNYQIKSARQGASTKVTLLEEGTDISEHKVLDTYKKIKDILGMDFEVFSQITYQSSVDLLDFIKATDTNRKKFLINLFNLQKYLVMGDAIKLAAGVLDKELIGKNGEMKGIMDFLEEVRIPEKKVLIEVPSIDESLRDKIAKLNNDLTSYEDTCKKIDNNNLYITERDSLKFDTAIKDPEREREIRQCTNIIEGDTDKIKKLTSEIAKSKKELNNLDISDTCYVCNQSIDNSKSMEMKEVLQDHIDEATADIVQCTARNEQSNIFLENFNAEVKKYNSNKKNIEKFEQLSQVIDTALSITYPDFSNLQKEKKQLEDALRNQVNDNETARSHNESVNMQNTKIDALIEQKQNFLARQTLLNDDIITLNQKLKNLNILKKAFSPTGIVAFKLENLSKELEKSINKYLSELSDGQFQVLFRLTKEKLNIVVINNGKETSIEGVSSGEFSRIQTAILLAIRNLLSKIGGNHINLLFLDEITGVLDDEGKEKLIEILQVEERMNVFLISHDFTHPLIDKIAITKKDNISIIE